MLEQLSGETQLFPIIGDPIVYVKSPSRMTRRFEARGVNGVCVPMQVAEADLDVVMHGLGHTPNVRGLLVTMPHKFAVFRHCATVSDRSRRLEAVNVMRRNPDLSWHGDMLDGLAFVNAQVNNGAQPAGAKVLLLGAGGAGSAIAIALLEAGVRELLIHDSDAQRVARLIDRLSGIGTGRARAGAADPTGCQMVCNATPMGMSPDDPLPVAAQLLAPSMFVGDVVAGHGLTPLLRAARVVGCPTADGVQMVDAAQDMMVDFMLNA